MDVSFLSVGLFKVNFPFVSSCASSVVKAALFLFKNPNGNRIMYGKKKRSTLTFNQFRPQVRFSTRGLPSSGGKLEGILQHKFFGEAPEMMKNTKVHKKMNKECR